MSETSGYKWLRKDHNHQSRSEPPESKMTGVELYVAVQNIRDICKSTSLPSQLTKYVSNFEKVSYYDYDLLSSNEKIMRTLGAAPKGADSPNIKTIEGILAGSEYNIDRKRLDEIIIALDKGLNDEKFGFSRIAFEPLPEDQWGYLDIANIKEKGRPVEVFGVGLIEVPVTKEVLGRSYNMHGTRALTRLYHEGYIGLSSNGVQRGKYSTARSMPAHYYILRKQPQIEKYFR